MYSLKKSHLKLPDKKTGRDFSLTNEFVNKGTI